MDEPAYTSLLRIHSEPRRKKIFRNAYGFLQGLVADHKINNKELDALHTYVSEYQESSKDGDIYDLVHATADLMAKASINAVEHEDLLSVIDCILEYRSREEIRQHEQVEELLGLCAGIIADGEVNYQETIRLQEWLVNNSGISEEWPACDIVMRIDNALQDGYLDKMEAKEILDCLSILVGGKYTDLGTTSIGLPIDVRNAIADDIEVADNSFCFTGKFFFGSRESCKTATKQMGGLPKERVTNTLDYLVVGSLASPFWTNSHFGTKIKRVMEMRDDGPPYLIGENTWRRAISP